MRLLVLGGSGFVGRRVLLSALRSGLEVSSVSRSGAPSSLGPELSSVEWLSADIERPEQLEQAMRGVDGVVSCVGVFGSNEYMRRINGQANATAVEAAAKAGVRRFAYISAQKFRPVAMVAPGYFEGKEMAEEAVGRHFGSDGCVLRPPAIYGTREVGKYLKLPLGVVSRRSATLILDSRRSGRLVSWLVASVSSDI